VKIEQEFEIYCVPEFKKDLKKLRKKYRTIEEDLKIFLQTQISLYHKQNIDNKGIFPISDLGLDCDIFKAKKFRCRALKGKGVNSGIRVIYSYEKRENDKDKITLIEIYYKGQKENEDKDRIFRYFGNA